MFVDAQESISKVSAYAEKIKQLAVMIGASEQGLNCHNALLACEKALRELMEYRREAEAQGKTVAALVKPQKEEVKPTSLVPPEFNFAPPHWIEESSFERVQVWKNSCRVDKIVKTKEVTASGAQRLRAGLQGQLESLFSMVEDQDWTEEAKEDYKREIIESYKRDSYSNFSESLSKALWTLNLGEGGFSYEPIEEEYETLSTDSTEFQTCVEFATIYSGPVREHLVEWAEENEVQIHKELLAGWAAEYPDRLFPTLLRKRMQMDDPINDWIPLALNQRNLVRGDKREWTDEVSFEMLERLIEEAHRVKMGDLTNVTHDEVVDNLARISLEYQRGGS